MLSRTRLRLASRVGISFNLIVNELSLNVCCVGFVEGTGVISIEAAHASRNSTVDGISWAELPRIGRTLSGVSPLPLSDKNFSVGAGPTL